MHMSWREKFAKWSAYWHEHAVERWQLLLAYLLLVGSMALSVYWTHTVATRADERAAKTQQQFVSKSISDQVKSESICTRTNQGEACRDLFTRLATSITTDQRRRLGCQALAGLLPNPTVEKIRKDSDCANYPTKPVK